MMMIIHEILHPKNYKIAAKGLISQLNYYSDVSLKFSFLGALYLIRRW